MNWWAVGIGAAITAISLINAGIKKYKENLREAAQESAKQAEESAGAVESLTQLKTQLEDGSKSTDALTTAFKEQLKQMGYTETGIDNLIKKYGGLEEAIKGTTEEVLAKNQADARAAKDDAKKSALTELGELVEGFTYEGGFIRLAFSVNNWIPEDIGRYSKEIQDEFQKFYDLGKNAESTQNIDDLLAYYNQAQKVLDLLKNAAIDDEDIYNESAYIQAKVTVDKLSASMDGYANAITRVHEADAQIELSNFLKTNDIATKEDFDAYIKGVEDGTIGMVDGKEASDAYKQVLIDVANNAFPQFSNAVKDTGKNADEMTVSLSELEGASDKIKTLGSAFKELSDDGYITTKTLGEIQTATGLSGDEWENYKTKLLNAKSGSSEFNQIMSEMTYKILDNAFASKDLTSITEDEVEAILRENGVVNASAVAHDWLSRVKNKEKATNFELGKTVDETKSKLIEEAKSCGITTAAYAQLVAQEIVFNQNDLDISGKIQKLATLQQALGNTASTAILLNNALSSTNTSGRPERDFYLAVEKYGIKKTANGLYEYNGVVYKAGMDAVNAAMAAEFTKGVNVEIPKVDYSGASSSSGSDKNKPDYEDPTDAIINRINLRSKELEQQEEEIQNLIEIAELENDYKKQISLTNDLIATRKKRVEELNKANAGLHNEAEYLRNSNPWDEESWFNSQGEATEAYYKVFNSANTKEEQEKIKNLFESLSKYKKAYADNAKEITDINKQILQDEEKIWDLRREEFDARMEESEYYIQHSKDFGWENGDNEIAARKRVLEWIQSDYYKSLIKEDKDYYEILNENRIKYNDALKEEFNKGTDFASSFYDSKKTLLQSYFDVINSIAEAQHEINKELEASKTMYEYLDEETRKLLFNQEDYNALSKELIDIQSEADRLKRQYEYDLDNSTLYTIEEITSNYEMQYEMLIKSYEIAKADLEIAKKKAKLNNVLNERNVRMFINGQWQWVANTQEVINAQSELADAEWSKKVADAGLNQTEAMNELSEKTNHLTTTINKFESGVITLGDALQEVYEIFAYQLPYYVKESFSTINDPASKRNLSIGASSYNSKTGETLVRLNESQFLIKKDSYASGAKKTKPGLADINEILPEGLMTNDGRFIPMANLSGGEMIFNHKMMENLWRQSQVPWNAFTPSFPSLVDRTQTIDKHQDNRIIINGMTVDSGSADGQALISALRRYVGNH